MSEVILRNVRKRFGQSVRAVHDLDLDIADGEFFVLLGPSGCGKTTTLRCVAGLEEPDGGHISIGGDIVADADKGRYVAPENRNVGMVFQSYALWPHMSVRQNVGYPLRVRSYSRDEASKAIGAALELVGLEGYGDRYPSELSGGQQQRVALARAIVARPRLLLFDEPLSNLDTQLRLRLRQDLRRVHTEIGYTAVYVTHDHGEALALADRIAVMNHGRLEQVGTPSEIFLSPRTRFAAEFVGYDNFLAGEIETVNQTDALVRVQGISLPLEGRLTDKINAGSRAIVAARASHVTASPINGHTPELVGTLSSLSYIGDRYQGEARVGSHTLSVTLPLEQWGTGRAQDTRLIGSPVALSTQDLIVLPYVAADEVAQ
ncbi:ABC transporter ATP-binding protein [Asticcacaulis tiandongensis]|uniref:ABC transporter ATP-binding protein n=1 Tax=Asticcacaulis tiandongensis TaxID=2565365 RepID=UPI00112DD40A|nr:ABC transporter ATP-binding protein [Asticcacaulis tiandongensis]